MGVIMIITKNLSPRLATELTQNVDDYNQVLNSKLFGDWFKSTYCICIMHLKPEIYNEANPGLDAEAIVEDLKKKSKPQKAKQNKKGSCAHFGR